jgi:hypothetical protein
MSQRDSGYARKEADFYPTPEWVTLALVPHLPRKPTMIWECASGQGHMVRPLETVAPTIGSDINAGLDFLQTKGWIEADAIITNPPFDLATEFIEHALRLMEPVGGQVAMLLRTDFGHAKSRRHLFRDCPAWAKKIELTKRIMWFTPEPGSKGKSPSFNHAWYLWDWKQEGAPTLAYGP